MDDNAEYMPSTAALLYIVTFSRLDIVLVVSILSRKIERSLERDRKAVQEIIMYLNSTKNLNLFINNRNDFILDAD